MEIKEEDAPQSISVAIQPSDWVWLQTHKGDRNCKATTLLRMAIRERQSEENGEMWKSKAELKQQVEQMSKILANLWKSVERAEDEHKLGKGAVYKYYENLCNASPR